jgi:riboflavin synthase
MFTGIIETTGEIARIETKGNYRLLAVRPHKPLAGLVQGESMSVDGCCLTVVKIDKGDFTVEASQETTRLTIAGYYKNGTVVNLERALTPSGRLGGHFVTGHVDCPGRVMNLREIGQSLHLSIQYPDEFGELVVAKGSIAVNGISLTVNEVNNNVFAANIIPYTRRETAISGLKRDDKVNLEFDILGKYIARLMKGGGNKMSVYNKLIESGW